jgi:hypothetical protein
LQTIPWHCKSTVSGDPEVELAYSLEEVFAWLRDCSEQIERAGIMQGLPRIHSRPREGASYEASLDILIPALMKLRERNHSLNTLVLLDSLPDILLPASAQAASQKTYIPPIAVKTVVKYCGPDFLVRTLGRERARNLQARYAQAS